MTKLYDVLIVGGGPAGLTAGLYASRAGLTVLLTEGSSSVSQVTVTDLVENYPGIPEGINGFELRERFKTQARHFGTEVVAADVRSVQKVAENGMDCWEAATDEGTFRALSLILATGAQWRRLGVPGEEAFIGKGISFCATCDGPFYRDRSVAVVGGGNTAIQEALFLTHFAKKVTVIHRRHRFRAAAVLQERALDNPKIAVLWDSVVEGFYGLDLLQGITVRNLQTGAAKEFPADGVFIFIGLLPNTTWMKGVLDLTEDGAIPVDEDMKTVIPGIFACGDCIRKSLRQVVTACGDGATAAYSAQLYVEARKGQSY